MNRTDRLLAIVLELQARRKQRAEDLAGTFEVSKRTIYRDVEALCEMGVPVVSVPGQGYSLVEGYFLPPLRFTTDEAIMLVLGSDFMADNFDAEYRLASQSAGRKIVAALPEDLRVEVESLHDTIHFVVRDNFSLAGSEESLQAIRRAIIKQRTLSFEYHTRYGREGVEGAWSSRKADPYGLVNITGVWYMVAYCHLRQDVRHFRIDRIEHLHVTDGVFKRPPDFRMKDDGGGSKTVQVRALFAYEVQSWVLELPSYYAVAQEDTPEGLLITFMVRQERDLLQWLLGWGRHVRVLEPQSLIDLIADEAEAVLQNHKKLESLLT